ncbi:uncharacterized protein LOC126824599 [Patella vulgata]|uniref:uncharacterized protein LOC126824599 n=1 Tax=Patella vulgata TaxID=6465 RepID=UPI00217FACAE|nr:uncharacterized protein LOC126824599 [Patella vulgata]
MDFTVFLMMLMSSYMAFVLADTKVEIIEEEVKRAKQFIVLLKCKIYGLPAGTETCDTFSWLHESEDLEVEQIVDEEDFYQIETSLSNNTSSLELLSPSDGENTYTCIAECGINTYRIDCWLGELQYKERSNVCSKRYITDTAIIDTPVPRAGKPGGGKRHKEVKIAASVVCMVLVGMIIIVIIKCRIKRLEALKHVRVTIENANQRLLYPSNEPQCQRFNIRRNFPHNSDNSPIYRPPSHPITAARPHRTLQRLAPPVSQIPPSITSRPFPKRLVLQEMNDGSQLVFIPGSALPSYEDSQNNNVRSSMRTFQNESPFLPPCVRDRSLPHLGESFSRIPVVGGLVVPESTGELSSPPSYTSMVQLSSEEADGKTSENSAGNSSEVTSSELSSVDGLEIICDTSESNNLLSPVTSDSQSVPCSSNFEPPRYPIHSIAPPPVYEERTMHIDGKVTSRPTLPNSG